MVIDELIVVLGLDARKFTEGQREALDAFKKGKEGAIDFGKTVEHSSMKMSEVFGIVRKGALGIVGAFVGGEAAAFIDHVINMDAATGRMAKTIGTSVENLGIWQSMIRQVGGSAEEATSALSAMQTSINNVRAGNGLFDDKTGFLLNKIGGLGGRNADQVFRDLQKYFTGEIGAGRMNASEAATQMGWLPGMNQSMINLMLSNLREVEDAARKVGGATDASAEAAEKLQSKFSLMVQAMERFAASMIPIIDLLMKPLKDITKDDIAKTGILSGGMSFERGGVMDRLDTWLWGEYGQHGGASSGGGLVSGAMDALRSERAVRLGKGGDNGRSSAAEREGWISSFAAGLGIDPKVALGVARSEGFTGYRGDGGTSFGDFQLHLTPGGRGNAVGDQFRKATGLDPSDPANEKAMDEFALKWASMHGWGDFHGAARTGIGQWQGIGARNTAAGRVSSSSSSSTTTHSTTIGKIEVNAPNATDADGIARDIAPAIKHSAITAPANSGLV